MDYRIIYLTCFGWIIFQVVRCLQEDDHDYPPVALAGYTGPRGSVGLNSSNAGAEEHYEEDDHDHEPETYAPYPQPPPNPPYPASNASAGPVKDQHYGQPYAQTDYRTYRSDAQNYERKVDPNVKNAPYVPAPSGQYNPAAVADQHYGQPYTQTDYRSYRSDAQNYARKVDPTVKNAPYVPAQYTPPAVANPLPSGQYNPSAVADQHYGQPYAQTDYRTYRSDAQNYARKVDPAVKSAPYLPSQYNTPAVPDQHYGQPHVAEYSTYRSDTKNYVVKTDPAVQNAYYTQPYAAPYQASANYPAAKVPPYSPPYTAPAQPYVQGTSYRPIPAINSTVDEQHYGQPAGPPVGGSYRPVPVVGSSVQDQHYGQPHAAPYQTSAISAPYIQPAVKAPPYSQAYNAAPQYYAQGKGPSYHPTPIINNSIVHEQHYGQPAVPPVGPSFRPVPVINSSIQQQHYGQPYGGDGYRPYQADARNYVRPAAAYPAYQGGYPATGNYASKSDSLCTISETPVDKSVYCGLPNLKIVTGYPIDPVKLAGEWYVYRHSPVGPALINMVHRVRIIGEGTELPGTSFPGVGAWAVSSGFRTTTDAVCDNHFYVGFVTRRGTQVIDAHLPERNRIEPTVYHTLLFDERRAVWLNYECARYNSVTGVCAVPNLYVNVRERPDLMSRDDQAVVDAAVNQVLAPYCMNISQLPKQIYTNHKGACADPTIPKWLNMKIQGIVAYNRKIDRS